MPVRDGAVGRVLAAQARHVAVLLSAPPERRLAEIKDTAVVLLLTGWTAHHTVAVAEPRRQRQTVDAERPRRQRQLAHELSVHVDVSTRWQRRCTLDDWSCKAVIIGIH